MSPISIPGKVTLAKPTGYKVKLTNTSLNPDPYYGAVSLLLSGDGANNSTDIRDSSRTPKAITAFGDAKISTAQSKWNGSSIAFDGNYDYLSIPDNDDWDISGDYTVEFWARMPSQSTVFYTLGYFGTAPINAAYGFALGHYLGAISLSLNGSVTLSSAVLFTNTWQHIAFVISGASAKVYVDGVSVISTTSATTTTSTSFIVGNFGDLDANRYFNGYIDDLRITRGISRYNSNFTPPTQPFLPTFKVGADPEFYNTSLLLHGDGANGSTTIIDSSPTPKTVTAYGDAQISTAQSKFGGSSIYFDGSGDYLNIGYNGGAFDFGSSDWTVEFWIYLPSLPNAYKRVYSYVSGSATSCFFEITNSNQMTFGIVSGATVFTVTDPSAMTSGVWTYFAGVRNGSSLLLFRAGVQVASLSVGTNSANGGSGYELFIGRWHSADTTRDLNGYIDDLRITKGVARYTSNFTPPTAPFPDA